ncbi:MAG: glycine cleavage system protein GcvH [Chitinivibrionia bacterium]|nr:glycine cleavage system protein GcvH [Chitinivibrionia bacterium]
MKPEDMRFTKEHEWVAVNDDASEAAVGITDYAAGELGDIVYIELPKEGAHVRCMQPMGTIEAVKTVADLYSPLSGVVSAVNKNLENSPEIVNKSPFGDGWFVRIRIADAGELDRLMNYTAYRAMIGKE